MENNIFDENTLEMIAASRSFRKKLAFENHFVFASMYLPHHFDYPLADFHKDIFNLTHDRENKLAIVTAFRGSGKSTLITLSYSIWAILGVQQKKLVLIVSQTQAQAKLHLRNIVNEINSNELLKNDLGPFFIEDGTSTTLIFTNSGARIMIASVEQSIRGIKNGSHRPDLIILDDIEDMNSTRTYEGRHKMYEWYSHELFPTGDLDTRIILVGNLLHPDSLSMSLKGKIDAKVLPGISMWFPLIDDYGKCIWPQKFDTREKLDILKNSVPLEPAWQMEYLLKIVSDDAKVIQQEWIKYYDQIPTKTNANEFRSSYIGIDLAIGENKENDFTAMVVVHVFGYGKNTKIYVEPNPVNQRMDPFTSIEKVKYLSLLHNGPKIIVEDNNFQKMYVQALQRERSLKPKGVTSTGDKKSRLEMASTIVKPGNVLFPKKGAEMLINQLVGFKSEKHDDQTDAFSLVINEIISQITDRPRSLPVQKYVEPKLDVDGRPIIPGRAITHGILKKIF